MKNTLRLVPLLLSSLVLMSCASSLRRPAQSENPVEDPYLWLEEVESARSLDWARAHNAISEKELMGDARFKTIEKAVRKIVLAKDRIPMPTLRGGYIYNFWQDEKHVQGIWRRAKLASYLTKSPSWDVLLDVDKISKKEKQTWVFHGAQCLPPDYNRCLVSLSPGGSDASIMREFDLTTRKFLADGFTLPLAKFDIAWMDLDTVLVGTDFGPGSLTKSGYPRITKVWKRGTPLSAAKTIFEGKAEDVSVSGYTSFRPEGNVTIVTRALAFFEHEVYLLNPANLGLQRLPFPTDAEYQGHFHGQLLAQLRSDWKTGGKTFTAGSLISIPIEATDGEAAETVYAPTERSSLSGVSDGKDVLFLGILDNVTSQVLRARRSHAGGWQTEKMEVPAKGNAAMVSTNANDDHLMVQYEGFVTPPSILYNDGQSMAFRAIKSIPARFNAEGMQVEQFEAKSKDGTKVPYFFVRKGTATGPAPTLLYGYGGFEISETPSYLGALGKTWVEAGGAYALANIRGGGEFGPKWHQAAQKEHHQNAFDDFIAISEDLIARGITSPRRLGIMGGSNGGLLMGAMITQRPDLFRGVVCQVPLLDMLRYHLLLAGASWVDEYGSPDDPAMREIIARYSPYQNLQAGVEYPRAFFNTSTKDDRVHPGHARKMVARMEELGRSVLYFENIEGGHGGAANLEQRIKIKSMEYTYLFRQLAD